MIYFTADPHYDHRNIIKYTNRWMFLSLEEKEQLSHCPQSIKYHGRYNKDDVKHIKISDETIDRMNDYLLAQTNDVVGKNDTLYILGDFCFTVEGTEYFRRRINCNNIFLILGNHDPHKKGGHPKKELYHTFNFRVYEQHLISPEINGVRQDIFMSHYANRVWPKSHRGSWNLYGHSHGQLPDDPYALAIDVGVDCHDYKPISLLQVADIMSRKIPQSLEISQEEI